MLTPAKPFSFIDRTGKTVPSRIYGTCSETYIRTSNYKYSKDFYIVHIKEEIVKPYHVAVYDLERTGYLHLRDQYATAQEALDRINRYK